MRFIGHIVIQVAVNVLALLIADHFIYGVSLTTNSLALIQITAVIAAFNIILKPVLKLLLGPFILLTLGFALIAINAAILWLATHLIPDAIFFATGWALIKTTLILSLGNFTLYLARKTR